MFINVMYNVIIFIFIVNNVVFFVLLRYIINWKVFRLCIFNIFFEKKIVESIDWGFVYRFLILIFINIFIFCKLKVFLKDIFIFNRMSMKI